MVQGTNLLSNIKTKEFNCNMLWISNDFMICTGDEQKLKLLKQELDQIFKISIQGNMAFLSTTDFKALSYMNFLHKGTRGFSKDKLSFNLLSSVYKYDTPIRTGQIRHHDIIRLVDVTGAYTHVSVTHAKNIQTPCITYGSKISRFIPIQNINSKAILNTKPKILEPKALRAFYLNFYGDLYHRKELTVTNHAIFKPYSYYDLRTMSIKERKTLATSNEIWNTQDKDDIYDSFFNAKSLELQAHVQGLDVNKLLTLYEKLADSAYMDDVRGLSSKYWMEFIEKTALKPFYPAHIVDYWEF